ncbi:hypothetical protein C8R44DRAFT_356621 [Mycena epipterygia]|nr:hypothetical protein C8R44DRAFT_356621 [Mycena epipterygia]
MEPVEHTKYSYTSPFSSEHVTDPAEGARLHALLRSNCPPPAATDYRLQVPPSLAKVAEYDVEIAKLQVVLDRMVGDRAILQLHADGCLSVYAPIRRLPNEILLNIFDLCCPLTRPCCADGWQIRTVEENSDRLAQLHLQQLTQVCYSWRSLVLGTPSLWSTIEMDLGHLPEPPEGYVGQRLEILRSSLQRSAAARLQIYVRVRLRTLVGPLSLAEGPVLDLLARHSDRWQTAKIWVDRPDHVKHLAPAKGNLPLLQNLHISGGIHECDFFEIAPRLTELTLEEPIQTHLKLPWGQLRTVSYIDLFPEDLTTAFSQLSRCSEMTKLTFQKLYIPKDPEVFNLPSFVSDIHTFTITFLLQTWLPGESPIANEILGCITLRRASALHFRCCDWPLVWPQQTFLSFASRSSLRDTLKSLEIYNMIITAADLLQCLGDLPCLETLLVSDANQYQNTFTAAEQPGLFVLDDTLFRGLTWTADSDTCLVPRLHTFDCETYMQFAGDIYLDFIASRLKPGRTAQGPFQTSLIRYRAEMLNPMLAHRLSEFVRRNELKLRLERDCSTRQSRWPITAVFA